MVLVLVRITMRGSSSRRSSSGCSCCSCGGVVAVAVTAKWQVVAALGVKYVLTELLLQSFLSRRISDSGVNQSYLVVLLDKLPK